MENIKNSFALIIALSAVSSILLFLVPEKYSKEVGFVISAIITLAVLTPTVSFFGEISGELTDLLNSNTTASVSTVSSAGLIAESFEGVIEERIAEDISYSYSIDRDKINVVAEAKTDDDETISIKRLSISVEGSIDKTACKKYISTKYGIDVAEINTID